MKNRFALSGALCVLLLVGCGKKDAPPNGADDSQDLSASGAETATSESAVLPGIPSCPGFVSVESYSGDAQAGSTVLFSSQTVASLLDSYGTALSADGWTLESTAPQGAGQLLQFVQGDRFLHIQIDLADDASRLQVSWGRAAAPPGSRDSYEPEPEDEGPSDVDGEVPQW